MKTIKLLIIALCAVGAAFFYWVNHDGPSAIPDTTDSETIWMCRSCSNTVSLSAAKVAAEEERAGGQPPLVCPSCSQRECYRAAQCAKCLAYYFSPDVPGSLGRCVICFPEKPGGLSETADEGAQEEPPPPSL